MLAGVSEVALIGAGAALAVGVWVFMFRLPRAGIWLRTWVSAGLLSAYAVGALALLNRADEALGPIAVSEVAIGLGVGAAWLVATHIGHALFCRFVPGFIEQIHDLYAIRDRDRVSTMVGPIVAMGVAEELFFRAFLQERLGLAVAVGIYAGVQIVERKWALVLAALLGGAVWGGLFWWRDGLVAPVMAHVLWTAALTLVWTLKDCDDGPDPADRHVRDDRRVDVVDAVAAPVPVPVPDNDPEPGR